jgi:hypothetical protein
MTDINEIIKERGNNYGKFQDHASISQQIKNIMWLCDNWDTLDPYHKEALEMIAHKIARILNGNPDYQDSWDDIAGYATLVSKIIVGENP